MYKCHAFPCSASFNARPWYAGLGIVENCGPGAGRFAEGQRVVPVPSASWSALGAILSWFSGPLVLLLLCARPALTTVHHRCLKLASVLRASHLCFAGESGERVPVSPGTS